MKCVRFNTSQPEDRLAAYKAAAAASGLSLAAWMARCCDKELPVAVREAFAQRPGVGHPYTNEGDE
jgi:hypothetical protein